MQNSFLELRCKFLRLLKSCPPSLKIEPHYPAACSRLNGNCSWPRLIIDNLEEAVSLFDLYNHVPSLRAAAAAVQACKRGARCSQMLATTPVGSTLAGRILAVMAVQLIVGRTQPVFPHFIMTRRLPTNQLLWVGARAIHVLKYLEKLIHPRWPRTFEVAKRAVGVMVLLLT